MRVLQLMKSLSRGGAEVLAASLAGKHREDVEQVFGYFHRGRDTLAEEIEAHGARTVCIPAGSQWEILSKADRVARLIERERIDIIHCHLPLVGVVGRLAAAMVGCPVVYTEHNMFSSYHAATRLAAGATWPLQSHVIAVSEEVKRSLGAFGGLPPVTVIKNGVDVDRFRRDPAARARTRRELCFAEDDVVIGTVAVFRPAKRLDRWLQVAQAIAASQPRARFLLVGFGPLEAEVRRWAGEAGLGTRLSMPGAQADVRPFLAAMDAYLMTSDFEGLPVALLEAMATELPAISTAVGGIPEVLVDEEMGALADEADLAERAIEFVSNESRRRVAGASCRQRIMEQHSIVAMARAIEAIYDSSGNRR